MKITKAFLVKAIREHDDRSGETMYGPGQESFPMLPPYAELTQEARDAWDDLAVRFKECVIKSFDHIHDDAIVIDVTAEQPEHAL